MFDRFDAVAKMSSATLTVMRGQKIKTLGVPAITCHSNTTLTLNKGDTSRLP
jgi:hypothetical protein